MQIAYEMMPGWNLGNTLEASNWRTNTQLWNNEGGLDAEISWQGTRTTQEVIDYVKEQGFRSVRIPCAWALGHIVDAEKKTIDPIWMERVKTVVDYCINDGLYVVLNDHWDGGWLENHIAVRTLYTEHLCKDCEHQPACRAREVVVNTAALGIEIFRNAWIDLALPEVRCVAVKGADNFPALFLKASGIKGVAEHDCHV